MFILVTVIERDILVKSFHTLEEAQKEMTDCFYAVDGAEELQEEEKAFLGEISAWCNADDGDTSYDWEIFEIPQAKEEK